MSDLKNIYIYGAGGFGKEVHQLIDNINAAKREWNLLGYIDDSICQGTVINNIVVVGGREMLLSNQAEINVVFAIASTNSIANLKDLLSNSNILFPNLIHPSVQFDMDYNKIGIGNIITSSCLFTRNISIGNFNIFNTRSGIGHDVIIGDLNIFQPNVQISGNVVIGDRNYFGVNSLVLANKNIGNDNNLGASSVLIKNIKNKGDYFGIPAMKKKF
jgi:sugar O-acyltransferase (sialic acid O-acetyltransferase NeuD family)